MIMTSATPLFGGYNHLRSLLHLDLPRPTQIGDIFAETLG